MNYFASLHNSWHSRTKMEHRLFWYQGHLVASHLNCCILNGFDIPLPGKELSQGQTSKKACIQYKHIWTIFLNQNLLSSTFTLVFIDVYCHVECLIHCPTSEAMIGSIGWYRLKGGPVEWGVGASLQSLAVLCMVSPSLGLVVAAATVPWSPLKIGPPETIAEDLHST